MPLRCPRSSNAAPIAKLFGSSSSAGHRPHHPHTTSPSAPAMAPAVPRLRILSGASPLGPLSAIRCSCTALPWQGACGPSAVYMPLLRIRRECLHHTLYSPLTAASWRKCRLSVPLMALTSNQRLRRHSSVEVRIRERRTVRHLVQVSTARSQNVSIAANITSRSALYGNERFKPHSGKSAGPALPRERH